MEIFDNTTKILKDDLEVMIKKNSKLNTLLKLIADKIKNPIKADNKKVIIFSAFADTAENYRIRK